MMTKAKRTQTNEQQIVSRVFKISKHDVNVIPKIP